MKRDVKLFVDFDGTITKEDVGDAIFRKFGDTALVNEIIKKLLSDEISSRQCWEDLCSGIINVSLAEIYKFVDDMKIDETFHNFVGYCRDKSLPLFILSDGFDLYIKRILEREKLTELKYFANTLEINEEGKFIPSFPYASPNCRSSANCKRDHIISNSSDDEVTVFIGDGNSDKETVHYCDYIFAKDDLLKYCEKERISFFPFKNFNDVINRLDTLLARKNIRKRHQAELKRKEAYTIE